MAYYTKLDLVSEHILSSLPSPRPSISQCPPLMVAIQGPQGSGKTYITNQLRASLSAAPHELKVAVFSIDDLYLPYTGLRALYDLGNPMLKGRGLPGTHDVALGVSILKALQRINDARTEGGDVCSVDIPSFDKSLHGGFGDRVASVLRVDSPLDVVIFEGWFVGFYPLLDESRLRDRWSKEWAVEVERLGLGYMGIKFEDIVLVNEKLRDYLKLWQMFSVFVQIAPHSENASESPYANIYSWRLEQEHYMKSRNGGKGMTDEQVKAFVDRYIPGYVFFGGAQDTVPMTSLPWHTRGIRITIGKERETHSVEKF